MDNKIDMHKIKDEFERIQKQTGKFVGSAEITPNGLKNVELIPYGPGDLVLDVWNFQIRLKRAVQTGSGHTFTEVLHPEAYEREDVQKWLANALDAAGGYINRSGIYPVVVPVPKWLFGNAEKVTDEWITAAEAAQRWGLNDSTIRRAIKDKRIRPDECRKSGGTWLVLVSAIERLYGKEDCR